MEGVVLRYTPRPTYPDSPEWCCMPSPENCGGIDMLFIISFCINYISQNGKEETRNGRRGRSNLVCAVCLASIIGFVLLSLSVLIRTWDHKVRLMKVRGTLCARLCVCVWVFHVLTNPCQQASPGWQAFVTGSERALMQCDHSQIKCLCIDFDQD